MKTLLLTNDDGYLSQGIQRLREYLSDHYNVYIVAPDRERSGISMSLTINQPLRLNRIGEREFIVDGTPSDCINIALQKLMHKPPDFIISGMNEGENLCEDVLFSGTVAGAFIGNMYGIPSMAVSLIADKKERAFNFEEGARITGQVLGKLLPIKNINIVYNLNIPAHHNGQIAVTSLGLKHYKPTIIKRIDPRGQDYYWIGTGNPTSNGEEGTDLKAIKKENIVLSVLKYDLNDSKELKKLSEVFIEKSIN